MKVVKITLGIVAGLAVLLIAAAAIFAATFDANRYKDDAVRIVKEKTGRTLSIEGDIGLSFFPRLSLLLGKTALSDSDGNAGFARVDAVQVGVDVLPLFAGKVKLDRIVLSGLQAEVVRYKDGRSNIDDLTGGKSAVDQKKPAESGSVGPSGLDVEGISVRASSLGLRDEREGTNFRLGIDELATGRIASGVPGTLQLKARFESAKPKANGSLNLQTGYRFDLATRAIALTGLALQVTGDLPGAAGLSASIRGDIEADAAKSIFGASGLDLSVSTKDGLEAKLAAPRLRLAAGEAASEAVNGSVKLARPGLALDAKLALASLASKGDLINFSSFTVEFSGKQGDTAFNGRIATPVALNLKNSTAELGKIAGELSATGPSLPGKSMKAGISGSAAADWAKQAARGDLVLKMDDSTINAKLAVSRFSPLAARFDLVADTLDADRFAPPAAPGSASGPAQGAKAAKAGGEAPIDLSALKGLDLTGTVRVGQLTARKIKADNLNLGLRVSGGRAEVNPLAADLYGGKLAGQLSADANGNRFGAKAQLTAVNIGPLLRDAADKDLIDGRGNVAFDLETAGSTVSALKKGLGGSANLQLKDGAIKGINLAETFRKAKSLIGSRAPQEQGANKAEKTDFSELSASFAIRDGIARNQDLSARSPFLRLAGAGDINIGTDAMDYLAKASVVASSSGQGGADLSGLTIPVRVSGPFDNLKFGIDFGAMVGDTARQKVEDAVKSGIKGLFKR